MIVHTLFFIVSLASQIYGDWLSDALTYQRELTRYLPLNENVLFGTHNSFNYYNPKYTFPEEGVYNQKLNITEQLNLGIRYINLDIHFIPQLNDTKSGALRVCHASKKIYDKCMQSNWQYCTLAGIPNYGPSDSGCFSFHWTFESVIQEISKWISENPREFILVEFDDGLDNNERSISRLFINQILQSKLENKILLPSEFTSLLQSKWPTLDYLVKNLSKNIAFANSYNQMADENGFTFLFKTFHNDENYGWPATMIKYFREGDCSSSIYTRSDGVATLPTDNFGFFQEDLSVIDLGSLGGVIYDGAKEGGTFNQSTVQKVLECGQTTWLEKLTAEKMKWNVWSWDSDQIISGNNIKSKCAVLSYNTGRWKFMDCSTEALFACQSDVDKNDWKFTEISKSWNDFSKHYINESMSYCPTGYSYSIPTNPYQNGIVRRKALQLNQNIYILTRNLEIEDGNEDEGEDGDVDENEVTTISLILDNSIVDDKSSSNSITSSHIIVYIYILVVISVYISLFN